MNGPYLFALGTALAMSACGDCDVRNTPPRGEAAVLDVDALRPSFESNGRGLAPHVLELGLRAAERAWTEGWGTTNPKLAVIDFSRPSGEQRLHVFDLTTGARSFRERVSHGAGRSLHRQRFSNEPGSHLSSLGLYVTGEVYDGAHGRSLRLHGLEPGFNDNAFRRAIVIHGARYATTAHLEQHGRLGRSHGCPAVRPEVAREMSESLGGGALLLSYYPDEEWLTASRFLTEPPSH